MKWVALSAEGEKSMPLFAMIPTGKPWTCANPYNRCQLRNIYKILAAGSQDEERKGTNRHDGLPVFLLKLAEAAPVHQSRDHLPHVERLTEVRADYPVQLARRIERILRDSRGL